MGTLLYFLIAFVIFFFCYKKYMPAIKEDMQRRGKDAIEYMDFWKMIFISAIWPLALSAIILWNILDKLYDKFTKKN